MSSPNLDQDPLLTEEDVTPRDLNTVARENIVRGNEERSEREKHEKERLDQYFRRSRTREIQYLRGTLLQALEPEKLEKHFQGQPDEPYTISIPFTSCCGYVCIIDQEGETFGCMNYDGAILPEVRRVTKLPVYNYGMCKFKWECNHKAERSDKDDVKNFFGYVCGLLYLGLVIGWISSAVLITPGYDFDPPGWGIFLSALMIIPYIFAALYLPYSVVRSLTRRDYIVRPSDILQV